MQLKSLDFIDVVDMTTKINGFTFSSIQQGFFFKGKNKIILLLK